MMALVIGSHGYIGRHLIKGLESIGVPTECSSSSDGTGIDPVTGLFPPDYSISKNVTTVAYLAQSPYYREPNQAHHVLSVNLNSAVIAAKAARNAGVGRFIYISTGSVYAPSFLPLRECSEVRYSDWYSLSKIQGEQAMQMFRSDMEVIIVRLFGVYGPFQRARLVPNLIKTIVSGGQVMIDHRADDHPDNGGFRISLCHVDDVVDVLINLILKGGPECLNLAGNVPYSIREVSTIIGELLCRNVNLKNTSNKRRFDLIADISKLKEIYSCGFIPLRQGLERIVEIDVYDK